MRGRVGARSAIIDPMGDEIDDMVDEDIDDIFGHGKPYTRSKAELYIRGRSETNPMRQPHFYVDGATAGWE